MQVKALMELLSRMPPTSQVYFKDYGSDQDQWCAITKVSLKRDGMGSPLCLSMKPGGRSHTLRVKGD